MNFKKIATSLAIIAASTSVMAQGWPTAYQGVMLQGFSWNSYDATNWYGYRRAETVVASRWDMTTFIGLIIIRVLSVQKTSCVQ